MLARVELGGLVVVDRLVTGAGAALSSVDSGILSGIDRAGQYVLVQVEAGFGIVAGTVSDAGGAGVVGALLDLRGARWLAISGAGGSYAMAAPPGPHSLGASHPYDSTGVLAEIEIAASDLALDLTLLPIGPLGRRGDAG